MIQKQKLFSKYQLHYQQLFKKDLHAVNEGLSKLDKIFSGCGH